MGQQEIIQVLEKKKEWVDSKEIAEKVKGSRKAVQQCLKRMFPQDIFRIKTKSKREGYQYKLK